MHHRAVSRALFIIHLCTGALKTRLNSLNNVRGDKRGIRHVHQMQGIPSLHHSRDTQLKKSHLHRRAATGNPLAYHPFLAVGACASYWTTECGMCSIMHHMIITPTIFNTAAKLVPDMQPEHLWARNLPISGLMVVGLSDPEDQTARFAVRVFNLRLLSLRLCFSCTMAEMVSDTKFTMGLTFTILCSRRVAAPDTVQ